MKTFVCLTLLILAMSLAAENNLRIDLNKLLEFYNPDSLKTKDKCEHFMSDIKGNRYTTPIKKELAQLLFHEQYKYYGYIFPGKILIDNDRFVALTYKIIYAAGGHCEHDKLVVLKRSGELIANIEFSKYLADSSGRLVKENVFISDSLMIFKNSEIDLDPRDDSIQSLKIEMQTVSISDSGELIFFSTYPINTQRNYYWISTDVVKDSTLEKYNKQELAEIRNEIFAAHGYQFKSEKWQTLFGGKSWYEMQFDNVNELLSIIEKKNIEKILIYENLEIYWIKSQFNVDHYSNKQDKLSCEISYPSNWFVKIDSFLTSYGYKRYTFKIENIEEKVIVAGGGPFTEQGSFFQIEVFPDVEQHTIEEFIRNADLPEREKIRRLQQIIIMKIGGIETSVWAGVGGATYGYNFVYKGRIFKLHCMSGSREQYEKDLPIFEKIVN